MGRLACLLFVLAFPAFAAESPTTGNLAHKFPAGGIVRMYLAAGGYTITGGDGDVIVVSYKTETGEQLKNVRVQLKTTGSSAEISFRHTPHNNFEAEIEIPRRSDLYVRLSVGRVVVAGVEGNKDIENHIGEVDISIPQPAMYGHRDASVEIGDIDASAFEISKGGFFRSFHQNATGKYRLHAHVGIGDVTLGGSI